MSNNYIEKSYVIKQLIDVLNQRIEQLEKENEENTNRKVRDSE